MDIDVNTNVNIFIHSIEKSTPVGYGSSIGRPPCIKKGITMDGFTMALLAAIYLLPAGVALTRKHQNGGAIIGLNILAGWTVVGWIAAFIWALTGNVDASRRTSESQIRCPACQEYVLAAARKCKHCGEPLAPQSTT